MQAISFYSPNLREFADWQKKVFDHFKISIIQVCIEMKEDADHGRAIDNWLQNNEWDSVAIFDIDCIPLKENTLRLAIDTLDQKEDALYGVVQLANHIANPIPYISPAFCCFKKSTWVGLDKPSFIPIPGKHDTGGYVSGVIPWHYNLFPSHVESPLWYLHPTARFGPGTTYEDQVYHAFESRFNESSRFVNKCKEVLGV